VSNSNNGGNTNSNLILVHDIGTTSSKSCLYRLGSQLELVAKAIEEYPLYVMDNGGVEQDPDEWWQAICRGTRSILTQTGIDPTDIKAMAFCAQMQGFIPVDKDGNALHRAMSYMDSRGTAQHKRYLHDGIIKIEQLNAFKLLNSLRITGGASASVKDPIWKYLWLRDEMPDVFNAMYRWMDVKDYLVMRSTGKFTFGYDSAHATFLFDTRPNQLKWSEAMCKMFQVNPEHLSPVVHATEKIGGLTEQAANYLGLPVGLPIFGGGGDLSLISLGAGDLSSNAAHIYIGTSGWVAASVDSRMTDVGGMVASILSAVPGKYNYISEQETSGRCLQWVRDHLALDEIGVYLEKTAIGDKEAEYSSLYDYLGRVVEQVPPGANGTIFTPWLHGNRSPFEDPYARGMFFNLKLETGKRDMIRAVLEGDAYHKRWMFETIEKKVPRKDKVRFVGGGARSDTWAQILADVTGKTIEVPDHPENAGAAGAALVCGVGLGSIGFEDVERIIRVAKTFTPRPQHKSIYDKQYRVYQQLYKQNKHLFKLLNA
jgi:xylulokinase